MEYGAYASLGELKSALGETSTTDDTILLRVLEAVSRLIDKRCRRHFYVVTSTRYYTAEDVDLLLLPEDLLAVTTLKTDDDGDRTYDETWASGDYDLEPYNRFPKTRIRITPDGDYSFPAQVPKGVEIAGTWGHGDGFLASPVEDTGKTVKTDGWTSSFSTSLGLTTGNGSSFSAGQTLLVDSEQIYITAVSTDTLTVKRGVNGTSAASHTAATAIYRYLYPPEVKEACILQSVRAYKRPEAPFGVIGSPEIGQVVMVTKIDTDVLLYLEPFIRYAVGGV